MLLFVLVTINDFHNGFQTVNRTDLLAYVT